MSSERIVDRFTTSWVGPYDSRAMQWAADHGIDFTSGNTGTTYQMSPTTFINIGPIDSTSSLPLDLDVLLRSENDKSDQETRDLHNRDTGLETGFSVDLQEKIPWVKKTRGQKLRECEFWITDCENGAKNKVFREKLEKKWKLKESDEIRERILSGWRDLEKLIEREVEEGWDWKAGIQEQVFVKGELGRIRREAREKGLSQIISVEELVELED